MSKGLDMKHQYSFDAFGKPKIERNSVKLNDTVFRQTMNFDTPYFKKYIGETVNMKHALVDPSHTQQEKQVLKSRTKFGVF
jgi:hypothetical protein